ncbi:MAG TPA: sigma-70 family RNA polymerase sigma factor, partial [Isosphaeraceae bacterium]
MIRTSDGAMQRQFGVLFDAGSLGGWGDGALLDRFLAGRDDAAEAAFASLVERHGPMVLRVCRATLGDEHDAHDAFQATFLILARKARSVRIRDTVGPWLHGVAWRVASRARAASYRRRRHERRAAEMAPRSFEEARRDDAEATLHEEVRRLPAGFREAVVLCDLEGLTTDQAAERLGTPVGTVRSRLYRGRDRLRGRLLRRGLAPAAVGMVVASGTASAVMVPAALAEATVGLAVGWCWAGTVPIRLAWLVNGGRYAMGMKSVAAAGLSLCMVAGVGGYAAQRPGAMPGDGPPVAVAAREESKRGESDLDRLQGRWMVVKDEIVGGTVGGTTPGAPTPQAITFRGEGIMITRRETEEIVPFTIDASGRPKTIRLSSPPASQPEILAYELDGGRLRLTFDAADSRRVPSGLDAPTPERSLRRYDLIRDPVSPTAVGRVPATPLPDFRADRDRLQGRWAIVSARENGREADDPSILLSTITFRGDELRIAIRGHGDAGYSFRIDPDSSPRAMLLAPPDPKQDRPQWCLYAFEGHKLRLAFDMTMKRPGRPESFDEKDAEHPISVMELVRDEPP